MSEVGRDPRPEVSDVSSRLLSEDASLVDSLEGVAAAGCVLLSGCSAASITLIETGRPQTVAATDDTAVAIDEAQYAEGAGPCLTSAREERVIAIDDTASAGAWPAFAALTRKVSVGSSLSVPLTLPGDLFGGLNLYGEAPAAFDEHDQAVAVAFAAQASAVVLNAVAYWSVRTQAANLARAMEHRAVIEQAKGIIMASQQCGPDEAFDLLRRASQRENRKLRDLAVDLVERTSARTADGAPT